ncbi:hypothetical protein [Mesorhizobium sp.]|uniref:hypothetical protein n=1 Tax=Mesorhizobium sp. TaxID=1871066 RepID=UPI000FE9CAD8|nr:hypothetical protein [Mesorhizobium sp.]RWM27788.1 MAG: hypothetical protein EOR74_11425 [Mesorhizobium sp.]RWM39961.1 MAG: hypothetical protein EOR75_12340 [Mesorhizobium sp.]TJV53188.1 MAG: hypothetical protein E5Y01_08305 [Mesorhizobium sp.]
MSFHLFPTAPQIGTAIIYSPNSGYNFAHRDDNAYFSKPGRKSRNTAIRKRKDNEFTFIGEPHNAPDGWVLVIRVSSDTHVAIFLYRGTNFFPLENGSSYAKASSDFDIATIAIECFRRNGMDADEVAKFLAGSGL